MLLLVQIRALLHTANVPQEPPLLPYHPDSATITEGALVSISNLQAHPCRVSFRRGDERHALLTVITPNSHGQPLGCVSPHAVLLAPTQNTVGAGHVLSAAPLLATAAEAHDQHQKWLKACVRPTVTMLLEAVNASRQQGMPFSLSSKAHQLGDGVWVLALENNTAVKDVINMLTTSMQDFEDSVAEVLAPLCVLDSPTALPPATGAGASRGGVTGGKEKDEKVKSQRSIEKTNSNSGSAGPKSKGRDTMDENAEAAIAATTEKSIEAASQPPAIVPV